MYAASVAMPAPTIPYDGISARQSAKFTTAAIPVITQLNCVRRVRPTPIAMTMYAAVRGRPRTRAARPRLAPAQNALFSEPGSARSRARAPRARPRARTMMKTRYVSTNEYVRFASPSSLERVGECRPRRPERGQQQHHRRRRRGRRARTGRPRSRLVQVREEEAVGEVDADQRQRGGHERPAEVLHLAQQRPRELQPELLAPVAEQHEVDDERPDPVADDHAQRPLVEPDDEDERRPDRDRPGSRASPGRTPPSAPRRGRATSAARSSSAPRCRRTRPRRALRRRRRRVRRSAAARMTPATRPSVAATIVYQKDVRRTSSCWARSFESK